MGNVTIGGASTSTTTPLPPASTIDGAQDYLAIYTASAGATQAINRQTFLGVVGQPVDISSTQILTNKTLTAPAISAPVLSGTVTGTYTIGGTPTFPAAVVTLTGTQVLTNKTLTSPTINGGSLDNATVTVDSIAGHTSATTGVVYGLSITGGALGAGSVTAGAIAVGAVVPNNLQASTGSSWTWQTWAPTWTNLTPGNGTYSFAKFCQIGKTVFVRLAFVLGSTSSVGTAPTFTLPVTSVSYTIGGTAQKTLGTITTAVTLYGIAPLQRL